MLKKPVATVFGLWGRAVYGYRFQSKRKDVLSGFVVRQQLQQLTKVKVMT